MPALPPLLSNRVCVFAGGGESHRECHLRGGEQDPGAADSDQPVPTQTASGQH